MKLNYIIIPLIAILTSTVGGYFTGLGMDWYDTLARPDFTPPGSFIGMVWTIIYILSTISALIVWNKFRRDRSFWWIIGLFIVNAILNAAWTLIWFANQSFLGGFIEMIILEATVIALIVLIWPKSRLASLLLFPYAGWVAFATYLAYVIWQYNS